MQRLTTVVLLLILFAQAAHSQERRAEMASLMSQGCVVYYGPEPEDKSGLDDVKVVILESKHWSNRSLRRLRSQGKTVIAYLSVGEIAPRRDYRPPYSILSKNREWNTLRVDPRDPRWRAYILRQAHLARSRGVDGLMLDTIDITTLHPEAQRAMADLVSEVRTVIPERYLIVNRGFAILEQIVTNLDAVIFENANDSRFKDSDRAWVDGICARLKKSQVPVLVLDYVSRSDEERTRSMAKNYGWSFYRAPCTSLSSLISMTP